MTSAQCERVNSFDKRCNWLFRFDRSLKNVAYPHSEDALWGNECDTVRKRGLPQRLGRSKGELSPCGCASGWASSCSESWCCCCCFPSSGAPLVPWGEDSSGNQTGGKAKLPKIRKIKSEKLSDGLDPRAALPSGQMNTKPGAEGWDFAATRSGKRKAGCFVQSHTVNRSASLIPGWSGGTC